MRASLVVLCLIGCGSREAPTAPSPSPPPTAIDAAVVATIDAAVPDAAPVFTAIDPKSLPEWTPGTGGGPPVEVYAVDMDPSWLALNLARQPWIAPVKPTKTITGRIAAPRDAVVAAIAREAGLDLAPPKLGGRGPTVDIQFADAPTADVLRLLADTGRVNIVHVGELPNIRILVRRASWEGVMNTIAQVTGRTVVSSGNTRYLVEQPLPALPKVASKAKVSIDIENGTAAHAIAVLRALTPVVFGAACGGTPISLRLRNVSLAEVLRAITYASGATLSADATCASSELVGGPLDDLRLVAIAEVGPKRAAAFDRGGSMLTATRSGLVTDIGYGFVTFNDHGSEHSIQLYPRSRTSPKPLLPSLRRALALVRVGDAWSAFVETDDGIRYIDPTYPLGGDIETRVGLDGVHFTAGDDAVITQLGRYH